MSADGATEIRLPLAGRKLRVADLFCGAGGSSTGAYRAARELGAKLKLVAINHWQVAIDTHSRTHPDASHLCADLDHVRPREAVPGGVLDLLIASPTCTYHSRARGGRPVHDQQRMDPWHVVRWCTDLRVHRLLVENVPEFVDWGPCNAQTGKPIASRKGEYFRAWLAALEAVGFRLDHKILVCANYGDPTTRERFFLMGRSDKKRLTWPEPSHVKGGRVDLLGSRLKWRAAAEIIDWALPGKSIFTRKKPLKPKTISRILAGAERYGWPQAHVRALRALLAGEAPVLDVPAEEAEPFLLKLRGTSPAHVQASASPVGGPVPSLSAGGTHVGLVMATGAGGVARAVDQPIPAITGGGDGGARPHFIEPLLMGVASTAAARPVSDPAPTITTGGGSAEKRPGNARPQLIEPIIVHRCNSTGGRSARTTDEPVPTVCTAGAGFLAQPLIAQIDQHGSNGKCFRGADEPLQTLHTKANLGVATPLVAPYYGGGSGLTAQAASEPLPAITTKARFGVADPVVIRAGHGDDRHTSLGRVVDQDAPLPAVTGSNEIGIAQAFLVPNFGEAPGQRPRTHSIDDPTPAITATGHIQLAEPFIIPVTHHGERQPHSIDEPLKTITGANRGELGIAQASAGPDGTCRIDILYRMLHWRELARAMSFDDEGEIYQFAGNATEITKQIGNAVPVRTAKALIKSLLEPGA